jgi:hypothetical protein
MNRDDVIRMAGHREVPPWVMKLVMDCVEAVREKDTELLQQLLWLCSKNGGWTLEEAANTICEIENILRARLEGK